MFSSKLSPQESEAMAASAAAVLGRVAEAVDRVERPPVRRLLRERVAALDAARAGRASSAREGFRLLSYNLMAATYSRHWDEPGSVHSYCSPSLTRGAHRMPRLIDEVRHFDADVVCLQEVDKDWFETLWQPHMGAAGFAGHFALKRGESSSEGVALFVRESVFDVLESRVVALDCATNAPPELGALLRAQPLTAEGMRSLPTVGQLVLLRSRANGRRLLVANTHLYFANPAVHVRVMQTAHLLWHAREWLAVQASTPTAGDGSSSSSSSSTAAAAPPTALIVAGDLNSDATDAVLRLLTT
jgi:2',5'-phosphodiesterase